MRFGEYLKQVRLAKNLTQEEVAEDFFVSRQTISSWENEKTYPDMASLIKLSDYYQISLDTLLKEDSGLREYLEKQDVITKLKPIKRYLTLTAFALAIFWLLEFNGLIHLHLFNLLLFVITFFVISALTCLNEFDQSSCLGLRYHWQKYFDIHLTFNRIMMIGIAIILTGITISRIRTIDFGIPDTAYLIGYITGVISHSLFFALFITKFYQQCL
ncbi:helix-turn-helix transcriptional regulator [Lactobacillus sp. ESL0703]|uniref:helix-turn-helix domain-containing protein n=1 Tax=Lactobacillus sp. ESL0703 TaxID=2983218 RepID=UPI0023F6FE68|nr:helix-turn-helix transcriptional regulator [Lactobacillus sp. ESL0703]MDF7668628.1 helix-turn-helix transcriptional regulator [Lactobacillus sp. ESL0703]